MADESSGSMTALDYIQNQTKLEEDAREAMPFDPNHCSHHDEPVRQQIFSCLTCREKSGGEPNGVCYSCTIQCHSDHDMVELLTKRNFSCDCGTERMKGFGGCNLRKNFQQLDKPSETNSYGQNFDGKFCHCSTEYSEEQPSTMYQCLLGDVCMEDWYHEECILGVPFINSNADGKKQHHPEGENVYDKLESAESEAVQAVDDNDEEGEPLEGLPKSGEFAAFICWKCLDSRRDVRNRLCKSEATIPVVHGRFESLEDRRQKLDLQLGSKRQLGSAEGKEERAKKLKTEDGSVFSEAGNNENFDDQSVSLFLTNDFQDILKQSEDEQIKELVKQFPFLVEDEPEYEPPEDNDAASSLLDAGTRALNSIPREKAIDGMHAYTMIKDRLRAFLKPFADEGKVVTETDVNDFFAQVDQEKGAASNAAS